MPKKISRRQFIIYSIEGAVATSFLTSFVFRSRSTLRIGIIGLGDRGRTFLSACGHDSVQVTALCDLDPIAIREGSVLCPNAAIYSDFNQLTAKAEVEAVAIATPSSSVLAEAALRRGKHVFLASPDSPDEETVDRLAGLARERSLQFGFAPHDPYWDIDALNSLLGLPLASLEGRKTRLVLLASHDEYARQAATFGLDLMHHAVQCAPDRTPSKVRAVSTRADNYASWSAKFLLDGRSSVDLHAQVSPELNPGDMAIVIETGEYRNVSRIVVNSTIESSACDDNPQMPGLSRFLCAVRDKLPTNDLTDASFRVLRWSNLLKNALPA